MTRQQQQKISIHRSLLCLAFAEDKVYAFFFFPLGFPCCSAGKESCHVGDLGLIPGLGRSPGEGKGYPLQYSGLENSMDCVVHGVTKSQTCLRDLHCTFLPPLPYNFCNLSGVKITFTCYSHVCTPGLNIPL